MPLQSEAFVVLQAIQHCVLSVKDKAEPLDHRTIHQAGELLRTLILLRARKPFLTMAGRDGCCCLLRVPHAQFLVNARGDRESEERIIRKAKPRIFVAISSIKSNIENIFREESSFLIKKFEKLLLGHFTLIKYLLSSEMLFVLFCFFLCVL